MKQFPVIYMLPGLLCDATVWEHQAAALARQAEIRIPDFRGCNSFRQMARSVLLEAPATFSIIGHSMGGRVALELLHLAPERIVQPVLMDLGVHPVQQGEVEERMELVEFAEREGMYALSECWIKPMLATTSYSDTALIEKIRTMVLRCSTADYRGQIQAALNRHDQSLYLRHIKQATLVVCGELDTWSDVAQHQEIVTALPNAQLEIVKGAGHMVTMEKPQEVTDLLLDWYSISR